MQTRTNDELEMKVNDEFNEVNGAARCVYMRARASSGW